MSNELGVGTRAVEAMPFMEENIFLGGQAGCGYLKKRR